MTTRFVQVSWGLQYTDVFLHLATIKAYIQSYQKGVEVDSTTLMSESIASLSQDRMDEEIHQHIRISEALAKEELHDYLSGWVGYFEHNLSDTKNIETIINNYNNTRIIEYDLIIKEEEKKFMETDRYKTLNHLDFYEIVPSYITYTMGALQKAFYKEQNKLVQYKKFFSAPDPDLIDPAYIPKYHNEIVKPIVSRCVNIAKKRLSYLKGENANSKLLPNTPIKYEPQLLESSNNKLKVNLTVEQLAFLFRSLKDAGLVKGKDTQIAPFIVNHFETIARQGKKISAANLRKLFSTRDSNIINFWIARFKEMKENTEHK